MGYFKTLMIDASAARGYQQRYDRLAQNDQVGDRILTHLVKRQESCHSLTTPTLPQPITREAVGKAQRWTQRDQAGDRTSTHLVERQRTGAPMTLLPLAGSMPITREVVGKALRYYRALVAGSDRDTNALNRCALNLEACLWYFQGDQLIVSSATTSRRRYHVTATACDCRATGVCWHRWAWMVLDTARRPQAPQRPVQHITDDIEQLCEEMF